MSSSICGIVVVISAEDIEALSPGFLAWLEETEAFSSRFERLSYTFSELDAYQWQTLMQWLHAAYIVGKQYKELKDDDTVRSSSS